MLSLPKFSLETTGKGASELASVAELFAPHTPVNIAFLGNENHQQRIQAAATIKALGFEPTPIISSRRLHSKEDFYHYVRPVLQQSQVSRLMVVGGDPKQPQGPYRDAMALLSSDLLSDCDIHTVVIAGYPEGHPHISAEQLVESLAWKVNFLQQHGYRVEITTQLAFSVDTILEWVASVRSSGIQVPIRIGVPSPTRVQTLHYFAQQFGVEITADAMAKYGLDIANAPLVANTNALYQALTQRIEQKGFTDLYFHLYTLDGLAKSQAALTQFVQL